MARYRVLGIDVGGSGIKGAVVDVRSGVLVTPRYRLKTPAPATPGAVAETVARLTRHFAWKGVIGCGMPGPIKNGTLMLAANLHRSWAGTSAAAVFSKAVGRKVVVINDADAAGVAEMRFGAGRGRRGTVILVTLGTGVGTAVFVDGRLVPNTEFGQMELRGKRAELRTAARVRKEKDLSWQQWGKRLDEYLRALEFLVWPDLFILGGGVSRKFSRFRPFLRTRARVLPARLKNEAGIIGAALAAAAVRR